MCLFHSLDHSLPVFLTDLLSLSLLPYLSCTHFYSLSHSQPLSLTASLLFTLALTFSFSFTLSHSQYWNIFYDFFPFFGVCLSLACMFRSISLLSPLHHFTFRVLPLKSKKLWSYWVKPHRSSLQRDIQLCYKWTVKRGHLAPGNYIRIVSFVLYIYLNFGRTL